MCHQDLYKNEVYARAKVHCYILDQVNQGIEISEYTLKASIFPRIPLTLMDKFIHELIDANLVRSTILDNNNGTFDPAIAKVL